MTKVLFKAGVLGTLEEMRDEMIQRILTLLQSQMRRFLVKKNIKKLIEQKKALAVVQRNVKAFVSLRNWGWLKLFNSMKHLLTAAKEAEEARLRAIEEERLRKIREEEERLENEKRAAMAKQLEATNILLLEEKNKLSTELNNLREVRTYKFFVSLN
jgi:myosin heavy subunit